MRSVIASLPLFTDGTPMTDAKPTGITLRKYQEEVLKKLRLHTTHGKKRLLLVAPCASGKMVMIAAIIKTSTVPVLFVAHRRELLDQLVRELAKYGITHVSVIRGDDDRFDPSATIQVASIQSLMRRDKPKAGLIFCDEAHLAMSDSWGEHVFDAYPDAVIIGATATPSRLDGQPLGARFEVMEIAASYSELIRLKHLIEPDVFGAPVVADLSGVRINHGDYNQEELGRVMGQQHLRGQIVQHWIERAHLHKKESGKWEPGPVRRTLVFASTVEHSRALCADFLRMSVRAAHLDGETPDDERNAMLAKLAAGELDVIVNVNVLLEGIDIPAIKCVVHARPTQSLVLWIQSTSRALRLWNGVTPLILDHAGNCGRHGMPHDDRIWSLTKGSTKHPGAGPTKMCPKCFAYVALGRYGCPFCGHEFPEPEQRRGPPKETDEKLVQLSQGDLQRAFYDEQVTKARLRGFKPGYAAAKFKENYGHWPPYGWSEATKSSFASDPAWQQALAIKEAYRLAHEEKQARCQQPTVTHENYTEPQSTDRGSPCGLDASTNETKVGHITAAEEYPSVIGGTRLRLSSKTWDQDRMGPLSIESITTATTNPATADGPQELNRQIIGDQNLDLAHGQMYSRTLRSSNLTASETTLPDGPNASDVPSDASEVDSQKDGRSTRSCKQTNCQGADDLEPNHDYLSDPADAPFAAWLDEEGIQ